MEYSIEQITVFLLEIGQRAIEFLPSLLTAIVIFVIGRYIARFTRQGLEKMLERTHRDPTVLNFVGQIVYYGVLAVVFLTVLNQLGVPTNSFVAAFGAFGIAVGLALQTNLANFASGLLILLFEPFKIGDTISVNSIEGRVERIQLLNTHIVTRDNRTVFVPNSMMTTKEVVNNNYLETRLIQFQFDIHYSANHHVAMAIIRNILQANELVLNKATLEIGIREFGENYVRIGAFPLVNTGDQSAVFYRTMSEVKDAFDKAGIHFPGFSQGRRAL